LQRALLIRIFTIILFKVGYLLSGIKGTVCMASVYNKRSRYFFHQRDLPCKIADVKVEQGMSFSPAEVALHVNDLLITVEGSMGIVVMLFLKCSPFIPTLRK
jgi:hypothetical protein